MLSIELQIRSAFHILEAQHSLFDLVYKMLTKSLPLPSRNTCYRNVIYLKFFIKTFRLVVGVTLRFEAENGN